MTLICNVFKYSLLPVVSTFLFSSCTTFYDQRLAEKITHDEKKTIEKTESSQEPKIAVPEIVNFHFEKIEEKHDSPTQVIPSGTVDEERLLTIQDHQSISGGDIKLSTVQDNQYLTSGNIQLSAIQQTVQSPPEELKQKAIQEPQPQSSDNTQSLNTEDVQPLSSIENQSIISKPAEPTNQELIDSALDYCQASNEFWEQGDLDNAIDALDKAYSLTLKVSLDEDPEVLQQKEDLRFTISKRIIEVYSSRFTVANGNHKAIPLAMNKHVERAISMFKGREKNFFIDAYRRSGKYRPQIISALKEAGLPEELSWLPFIESGFKVRALSRARALGIWQFIASTGYKYGLKRDKWIDERMDPEKSTKAAIAYLSELHRIFGDWTTVMAAYNCGEGTVLKRIRTQRINYLDNFWDLYATLPRETAFYVPKFFAVLHILNDPESYGITLPDVDEPKESEEVTVNKHVHLKTIAKTLKMSYYDLKDMNPELRHGITPNTHYVLKVPKGKEDMLLANLSSIPAYKPPVPSYVVHRVRPGESLSVIAERYHASIRTIMELNGLKKRHYLKVGWRLKIPTKKGYIPRIPRSSKNISRPVGELFSYRIKKGDSLWLIANRYKTTTKAIKALNNLNGSKLQIGQVLLISPGLTTADLIYTKKYRVRNGDSPYLIAKKHQMNLYEFLRVNNLTPRSTIYPGQVVQVIANSN